MSALEVVRNKIKEACLKAKRSEEPVLVAVSKKKALSELLEVYNQGQRVFGENYVQELIAKKVEMDAQGAVDADFHFIGHLQTNKVKQLLPYVSTIESVDSLKLLREISTRAEALQKKINCYFEVNVDEQESKGGFLPAELNALAAELPSHLKWIVPQGLMCIPDPEKNSRFGFLRLRELNHYHAEVWGPGLSMGMSQDYETAIECGATVVRVGSAIFGAR